MLIIDPTGFFIEEQDCVKNTLTDLIYPVLTTLLNNPNTEGQTLFDTKWSDGGYLSNEGDYYFDGQPPLIPLATFHRKTTNEICFIYVCNKIAVIKGISSITNQVSESI